MHILHTRQSIHITHVYATNTTSVRIQYENSFYENVVGGRKEGRKVWQQHGMSVISMCWVTVVVSRQSHKLYECFLSTFCWSFLYLFWGGGGHFAGRTIPSLCMLSNRTLILIWCRWLKMHAGRHIFDEKCYTMAKCTKVALIAYMFYIKQSTTYSNPALNCICWVRSRCDTHCTLAT